MVEASNDGIPEPHPVYLRDESDTTSNVVTSPNGFQSDSGYAGVQLPNQGPANGSYNPRYETDNAVSVYPAGARTTLSTVTLGSSAAYTSSELTAEGCANVLVTVRANQDSATDGLEIQTSDDMTNWTTIAKYTHTGSAVGRGYMAPGLVNRYFRVKYTNGASAQADFNLEYYRIGVPVQQSVSRVKDVVDEEVDSASPVKSVPHRRCAGAETGTFNGNGTTALISAPGAGKKLCIRALQAAPTSSHSGTGDIAFKFASGTGRFGGRTSNTSFYNFCFAADYLWQGGDNEAFNVQTASNASNNYSVTVLYDILDCNDVSS